MVLVTFVEADLWRLEALQCPVRDPFLPPQRQPLFEVGDGLKLKSINATQQPLELGMWMQ